MFARSYSKIQIHGSSLMNQLREDWSADWLLWNPMNQSGQTQGQATESTIVALAALEPSETMTQYYS